MASWTCFFICSWYECETSGLEKSLVQKLHEWCQITFFLLCFSAHAVEYCPNTWDIKFISCRSKQSTDPQVENIDEHLQFGSHGHTHARACSTHANLPVVQRNHLRHWHDQFSCIAAAAWGAPWGCSLLPFSLSHGMRNCRHSYGRAPPHPVLQPQTSSDAQPNLCLKHKQLHHQNSWNC